MIIGKSRIGVNKFMSYYDYQQSVAIAKNGYPFFALIMAAMRQADSFNADALRDIFPEIWDELQARYDSPGGYLKAELEEIAAQFSKGCQIAYIPDHVDGDLSHPDVEFGFVTAIMPERGLALCRYWRNSKPKNYLRTVANGERTSIVNLQKHDKVIQTEVDRLIELIDKNELTSENCYYEIEKEI